DVGVDIDNDGRVPIARIGECAVHIETKRRQDPGHLEAVPPVLARVFALDLAAFLKGEHADHVEGLATGIADDAVDCDFLCHGNLQLTWCEITATTTLT